MHLAKIQSVDHEGRGVARIDGKVVFIEGALPGETVDYAIFQQEKKYALARVNQVLMPSYSRTQARCAYYQQCGGCSMQHIELEAQLAIKQRVLEDAFKHIAKLKPEVIYPAIGATSWHYRQRARIGVYMHPHTQKIHIGFRARKSSVILDLQACPVLPKAVSDLLPSLHHLMTKLSIAEHIPQIELAVDEQKIVIIFRHLVPATEQDKKLLREFAQQYSLCIGLQPKGPNTIHLLDEKYAPELSYRLPDSHLRFYYHPSDFTQVNPLANQLLVRRAMQLLEPNADDRIADLFCGLGNFTLPCARKGAKVLGIEGNEVLTRKARVNAERNQLQELTQFYTANLFEVTPESIQQFGSITKMLLDPPRDGALAVVKALNYPTAPERIVYVSCNPATLARDAAILVYQNGYCLKGAGIVNMFAQTSHIESVALFIKKS